jgi:uncharacterized protein
MFPRLFVYFLLLFALAGPAQAKAPEVKLATPAMWEVQDNAGKGKLILLGTFHLLPKDINWKTQTFEKITKKSKLYVFELTRSELTNPGSQQLLLARGLLPAGQSLQSVIGPELFAKVELAGKSVGLQSEVLDRMRPWMASVLLATQSAKVAGFEPGLGVETVLQAQAAARKLPTEGLETMAEQVTALSSLDDDGARQMLEETAMELADAQSVFQNMVDAWASGDTARLEGAFLEDMKTFPKAYEALLKQRNLRWLPKFEALLKAGKPALIAVGAGHLVGPDGMVALLRAKGYRIMQIQTKK